MLIRLTFSEEARFANDGRHLCRGSSSADTVRQSLKNGNTSTDRRLLFIKYTDFVTLIMECPSNMNWRNFGICIITKQSYKFLVSTNNQNQRKDYPSAI